ncbi:hypothetical protein JKI95_02055 [Corynebacterium aquatimens]|uniref:hypothetical protein n=1 Tax=Corynebacterium aquatimens TaxID=1190508 RepID=UPI002540F85B|nr:hypothetical protein [Corynebacterium aquatimens]QYH19903.1 hypothetical protein JKI95_02055 [Corynebacterium aquatimens]
MRAGGTGRGAGGGADRDGGETTFTIHKRWLKSPQSVLTITAPRAQKLTGREADDALERILDDNLDRELAATLFLRQGQLDVGIAAAGIPSISKALDAAAGDGGERRTPS